MLFKKNNSLFFRLIISYVILVFIVLCMMYPVYVNTIKIVKEQAIKDSQSVLRNGLDIFDSSLEGIDQTIYNLYVNVDIKKLSTIKGELQTQDTIKIMAAQKHLNAVFTPYNIIENAFIVFANNDSVLTMYRAYDSKEKFYNSELKYEGENVEQWSDTFLKKYYNSKFLPEKKVLNNDTGYKTMLTYITSLPINSVNNFDSTIGVLIDKERLLKLFLSDEVKNEGWMYIQDYSGNVLVRWNYKGQALKLNDSGFTEIELDKQKTNVIYQMGKKNQIQIVVGIPQRIFEKKISRVCSLLYLFLGLTIITGVLAAAFLAYKNSRPVQRLLSHIESIGIKVFGGKNEFDSLESAINQLYRTKEQLDAEVLSQRNVAKAGIMERLLRNGINTSADIQIAKKYLSELPPNYRIVVMKFAFSSLEASYSENAESERDLLLVVLMNFLKEEFSGEIMIHPTGKDNLVMIMPQFEDSEKERQQIKVKLMHVKQRICESSKINIIFGISNFSSGMINLSKVFYEAQKSLRYGEPTQEGSIIWYENSRVSDQGICFDFYESQKLFQLLLAGEEESVLHLMRETISKNRYIIGAQNNMTQQLFYMLRGVIINARKELQNLKVNVEIVDYSEDVIPESLFESLMNSCISLCEEIDRQKRSHNDSLKEGIIIYIKTNYFDQNICAANIASKFNISEKYLFSFIKEQTGRSIGEYLEDIRMENAIRLMKETNRSISQIALDVGFSTQNSFYKAFKRVYGASPSAWRNTFAGTR